MTRGAQNADIIFPTEALGDRICGPIPKRNPSRMSQASAHRLEAQVRRQRPGHGDGLRAAQLTQRDNPGNRGASAPRLPVTASVRPDLGVYTPRRSQTGHYGKVAIGSCQGASGKAVSWESGFFGGANVADAHA